MDPSIEMTGQLEALLKVFDETPRKRSSVEPPPRLTGAYVHLEFAWGFARLADASRARELREGALRALDRQDPVHAALAAAYVARIEQAIDGAAPDAPLPPAINGMLDPLDPYLRYKVDRLRQSSRVLEPQERLEPMASFRRSGYPDDAIAVLRGMSDPPELFSAIESRISDAADPQRTIDDRMRLIDRLMDFLPRLPESQALMLVQRFLALGDAAGPQHRAVVLEDALKVAAYFGHKALVKQLVNRAGSTIEELGASGVNEVGMMLTVGLRSLRRVGLRDEAGELLVHASTLLQGAGPTAPRNRLGLASGLAYLGEVAQAQPIIDEALARLGEPGGPIMADRLRMTRAGAEALSYAPIEMALPGLLRLAQQLPRITDNYNTNSHFCVSLVDFADALVLGHVETIWARK